jgi:hypothetical protein
MCVCVCVCVCVCTCVCVHVCVHVHVHVCACACVCMCVCVLYDTVSLLCHSFCRSLSRCGRAQGHVWQGQALSERKGHSLLLAALCGAGKPLCRRQRCRPPVQREFSCAIFPCCPLVLRALALIAAAIATASGRRDAAAHFHDAPGVRTAREPRHCLDSRVSPQRASLIPLQLEKDANNKSGLLLAHACIHRHMSAIDQSRHINLTTTLLTAAQQDPSPIVQVCVAV